MVVARHAAPLQASCCKTATDHGTIQRLRIGLAPTRLSTLTAFKPQHRPADDQARRDDPFDCKEDNRS